MKYLNFKSEYDKYPKINIKQYREGIVDNYQAIYDRINKENSNTIIFECYPGVRYSELVKELFSKFKGYEIINVDDFAKTGDEITAMIQEKLSDDRVFAFKSYYDILDFYSQDKVKEVQAKAANNPQIFYGFGASKIITSGTLVYCDMARWEIQLRYRTHEFTNWRMDTFDLDILRKYKRSYFFEWRTADMIKKEMFERIDFYLDTNQISSPKMIIGDDFRHALKQAVKTPFRLVPYFDPGVWGGQWMKEVCNLDPNKENYAWSFDGVPEENSVYLQFGEKYLESPSINIVFYQSIELLGEKVFNKYGDEYPIRFDFLDTIEGGNLSLQVHPVASYIKEQFNIDYTQDESYYLLEALDDATVYLGLKTGVDKEAMLKDLRTAEMGEQPFPAEKYINQFPAKKHDHFLIPAGTIHCSGRNAMVLEISATPYIFTFKLWDWGRLGLDGIPRPVHIDHGEQVIQFDRDTEWVKNNLVDQNIKIHEEEGLLIENTGLHALEPIGTIRYTFNKPIKVNTYGSVNQLNLVDGQKVIVSSINNEFDDYLIHYAETFIVSENIKEYMLKPVNNEEVMVLQAFIK